MVNICDPWIRHAVNTDQSETVTEQRGWSKLIFIDQNVNTVFLSMFRLHLAFQERQNSATHNLLPFSHFLTPIQVPHHWNLGENKVQKTFSNNSSWLPFHAHSTSRRPEFWWASSARSVFVLLLYNIFVFMFKTTANCCCFALWHNKVTWQNLGVFFNFQSCVPQNVKTVPLMMPDDVGRQSWLVAKTRRDENIRRACGLQPRGGTSASKSCFKVVWPETR